ncbi:hypothetical protein ACTQ54_09795 [Fundicoccus sp. Sow4_H7]|uniref:hypothetical protein n=1 Tax=Fundicoccus sp. Sow4_H7 TaxID=3438784 RepID=UPI003F8E6E03
MPQDNRYQKGIVKLMEYMADNNAATSTHANIEENLKDIAPDVSRFMIEFSYADIYSAYILYWFSKSSKCD